MRPIDDTQEPLERIEAAAARGAGAPARLEDFGRMDDLFFFGVEELMFVSPRDEPLPRLAGEDFRRVFESAPIFELSSGSVHRRSRSVFAFSREQYEKRGREQNSLLRGWTAFSRKRRYGKLVVCFGD